MIIDLRSIIGRDVLSGAEAGKSAFAALVAATTEEPSEPAPLFLDFRDVEVATASALRESVVTLKALKRATGSKHYPVIANANRDVEDEIEVLMLARGDVFVACDIDHFERVNSVRVIGSLEPKQERTLSLVVAHDGANAELLMREYGADEGMTSTTAWNNRLASLAQRGLVREFSKGRAKFYRPLFERIG